MPDITIKTLGNEEFGAYCAMPHGGNGPVVIVIQEIFGVNANMRKVCDDFAADGYIAVCPDLFWRQERGVQLTDKTDAEWAKATALYNRFDVEAGVRDLLSTVAHVRKMPGCGGRIGVVGYCLGGKLAFLMASRVDVDAVVSYYGVGLETLLGEVYDIRMPFMMHIAALDQYVPAEARDKILRGIAKNSQIQAYVYEGVDHAFARHQGQNYNEAAATLANQRTNDLFHEYLKI